MTRTLHRYTVRRQRVTLRASEAAPVGDQVSDALDVAAVVRRELERLPDHREHFFALYLNVQNVIVGIEHIATGGQDSVLVTPAEVFRGAIVAGAAGIILSHNHPSGDPTPSPDDLALTRRMKACGELIGVPVIDHVVVADRGCRSLAEWLTA